MAHSSNRTTGNISTAVIETIDYLEEQFRLQDIYYERERLIKDREWINKILIANPGIQYIRVVKVKPEGGTFIKTRYYFDAYLFKRNVPGTYKPAWWMYIVPLQR